MRRWVVCALVAVGLVVTAPSASASFHLVKISEVYRGNDPVNSRDDAFVELQMYAAGQGLVQGKELRYYDGTGAQTASFAFPSNVANGGNQRTILVGDDLVAGDFTDSSLSNGTSHLPPAAGAVCFADPPATLIDCVAWGAFTGSATPLPVGSPASPSGFADSTALVRSIAPGCPTLLEPFDDTNDSATDFSVTDSPTPRNNSAAPTETGCDDDPPQTRITKKPKRKSSKRTARFKFKSSEAGSTFECKLDREKWRRCKSPKKVRRLKRGTHKFKVRATDASGNTDPTPAKHRFKVVRR